jgi:hypothetical protein
MKKALEIIRNVTAALGLIGLAIAAALLGKNKGANYEGRKKILADFDGMSAAAKWELAHSLDERIGDRKRGDCRRQNDFK